MRPIKMLSKRRIASGELDKVAVAHKQLEQPVLDRRELDLLGQAVPAVPAQHPLLLLPRGTKRRPRDFVPVVDERPEHQVTWPPE